MGTISNVYRNMSEERDRFDDFTPLDYSSVREGQKVTPVHDCEVPSEGDDRGTVATGINEYDEDYTKLDKSNSNNDTEWQWLLNIRNSYNSKWKWLSHLNQGVGEDSRSTDNHNADVERCVDVLCSSLDCTSITQERVHYLIERFDLKQLHQNAPYEAIVLATITMVANERVDGRHSVRFIRQEDSFDELLESLDVTRDTIRTIRQSIRETDVYTDTK